MTKLDTLKQQYAEKRVVGTKIRTFPVECQQFTHCDGKQLGTVDELVDEGKSFSVVRTFHPPEPVCEKCKIKYLPNIVRVTECEYGWDTSEISSRNDEWIKIVGVEPGKEMTIPVEELPTESFVSGEYITCPECSEKSLWSKSINKIGPCFFECPECQFQMDAEPPSEWANEFSEPDSDRTGSSSNESWDPFQTGGELKEN